MRRKYYLHFIFYTLYERNSSARNNLVWIAQEQRSFKDNLLERMDNKI